MPGLAAKMCPPELTHWGINWLDSLGSFQASKYRTAGSLAPGRRGSG